VYNPTVVYGVPYYPPGYSTSTLAATAIISFGIRHDDRRLHEQQLLQMGQDGLNWKPVEGQPESPVGPLVAYAVAEGYTNSVHPEPFHGYFFRTMTAQGANAKGGPKAYVVNGKMTCGFACC
jgi:hypothetical protein